MCLRSSSRSCFSSPAPRRRMITTAIRAGRFFRVRIAGWGSLIELDNDPGPFVFVLVFVLRVAGLSRHCGEREKQEKISRASEHFNRLDAARLEAGLYCKSPTRVATSRVSVTCLLYVDPRTTCLACGSRTAEIGCL